MNLKREVVIVALIAFVLSACGASNQGQAVQQTQPAVQQTQPAVQQTQPVVQQTQPAMQQPIQQGIPQQNYGNLTINITLEQAKEIAVGHAGFNATNVVFIKAQQDYDDGFINYDIDFVNGNNKYEYEISAIDGRILKSEIKMVNNGYVPQQPIVPNAANGAIQVQGIDVEAAKAIAVANAGFDINSVTFIKTKYDFDDGMAKWEIEFVVNTNKYEYDISAANGMIIKSKVATIYN